MKKTKVLFTICAVGIASLIISCSNAPSQNQIIPISAIPEDPGENPGDNGENPEDPGENPGDNGENSEDPGENPGDNGENPEDPGENPEDNGETTPENNPIEYQFHETVEYLPAGTDGSAGTTGTYVLFGDWPQTIKAQNVEIDTTRTMTRGGFTFYLGSDQNLYVSCEEKAYKEGYTYSDGTNVARSSVHSTKYFKVEPIKWRVLNPTPVEGEKKFLVAEKCLVANILFQSNSNRNLNGEIIYPSNYKYSNIRAYLNGIVNEFITESNGAVDAANVDWRNKGFLQSAFTTSAITLIADTIVKNDLQSTVSSTENIYVCQNTTDKIFLPSVQEMGCSEYGFVAATQSIMNNQNDESRIRVPTDYAKANYIDCSRYPRHFLRSPLYLTTYGGVKVMCVSDDIGNVDYDDCWKTQISIVPALCLE